MGLFLELNRPKKINIKIESSPRHALKVSKATRSQTSAFFLRENRKHIDDKSNKEYLEKEEAAVKPYEEAREMMGVALHEVQMFSALLDLNDLALSRTIAAGTAR